MYYVYQLESDDIMATKRHSTVTEKLINDLDNELKHTKRVHASKGNGFYKIDHYAEELAKHAIDNVQLGCPSYHMLRSTYLALAKVIHEENNTLFYTTEYATLQRVRFTLTELRKYADFQGDITTNDEPKCYYLCFDFDQNLYVLAKLFRHDTLLEHSLRF